MDHRRGLSTTVDTAGDGSGRGRGAAINLGYEREFGRDLAASIDLLHARSDSLMSNFDANVPPPARDAFGRPVYSGQRIDPPTQWTDQSRGIRAPAVVVTPLQRVTETFGSVRLMCMLH